MTENKYIVDLNLQPEFTNNELKLHKEAFNPNFNYENFGYLHDKFQIKYKHTKIIPWDAILRGETGRVGASLTSSPYLSAIVQEYRREINPERDSIKHSITTEGYDLREKSIQVYQYPSGEYKMFNGTTTDSILLEMEVKNRLVAVYEFEDMATISDAALYLNLLGLPYGEATLADLEKGLMNRDFGTTDPELIEPKINLWFKNVASKAKLKPADKKRLMNAKIRAVTNGKVVIEHPTPDLIKEGLLARYGDRFDNSSSTNKDRTHWFFCSANAFPDKFVKLYTTQYKIFLSETLGMKNLDNVSYREDTTTEFNAVMYQTMSGSNHELQFIEKHNEAYEQFEERCLLIKNRLCTDNDGHPATFSPLFKPVYAYVSCTGFEEMGYPRGTVMAYSKIKELYKKHIVNKEPLNSNQSNIFTMMDAAD